MADSNNPYAAQDQTPVLEAEEPSNKEELLPFAMVCLLIFGAGAAVLVIPFTIVQRGDQVRSWLSGGALLLLLSATGGCTLVDVFLRARADKGGLVAQCALALLLVGWFLALFVGGLFAGLMFAFVFLGLSV